MQEPEPTSVAAASQMPDAEYFIVSSRLVPNRDAGFTVSVLRRRLDMAAAGAEPTLLTVDPGEVDDHDADRAEWIRRDLLAAPAQLRNLFDEARRDPSWLQAAARRDPIPEASWPLRAILDSDGRTVLEVPVITGDAAWYLVGEPVRIWDDTGAIGWLPGYAGLYRAWLNALALRAQRPVVVICEARQVGEALVASGEPVLDPSIRILHTTHACHLLAPFGRDSPIGTAWRRWLDIADRFDGVLWLTHRQQRDVEHRFGEGIRSHVVPHPAPTPALEEVDPVPGRVVMLNSLIPRKRVDHGLRAFAAVRDTVPHAELHIYGKGAQRRELEALAEALGVADSVTFGGHLDDTSRVLTEADALILTSTNEGLPLVVLEALAHGVPVVAYDVRYGPRDALARGGGVLVPSGDFEELGSVLSTVLHNRALRNRLSRDGRDAAERMSASASMSAMAAAVRTIL